MKHSIAVEALISNTALISSCRAAQMDVTPGRDEWIWLKVGGIALLFVMMLVYYTLSAIEKYKNLHTPQAVSPLPVVIEKSLSDKFVDNPTFRTFEKYVHDSHHRIAEQVNAVKLEGEERGEQLEDLIRAIDQRNEQRSEKIHDRINDVLKETARIAGAFEQSQRRRGAT